jgi:hypothetical protein
MSTDNKRKLSAESELEQLRSELKRKTQALDVAHSMLDRQYHMRNRNEVLDLFLQSILGYVGFGEYLFVGGVCRKWRGIYYSLCHKELYGGINADSSSETGSDDGHESDGSESSSSSDDSVYVDEEGMSDNELDEQLHMLQHHAAAAAAHAGGHVGVAEEDFIDLSDSDEEFGMMVEPKQERTVSSTLYTSAVVSVSRLKLACTSGLNLMSEAFLRSDIGSHFTVEVRWRVQQVLHCYIIITVAALASRIQSTCTILEHYEQRLSVVYCYGKSLCLACKVSFILRLTAPAHCEAIGSILTDSNLYILLCAIHTAKPNNSR